LLLARAPISAYLLRNEDAVELPVRVEPLADVYDWAPRRHSAEVTAVAISYDANLNMIVAITAVVIFLASHAVLY
jgi:hypothetical protein